MTRALNSDPLRNFKFQVTIASNLIKGLAYLGFMSVSGLSVTTEVIPYREGGNNTTTRKMPGQSDFGPISLNRGLMATPIGQTGYGTNELSQWMLYLFSAQAGGGLATEAGQDFRVGVNIDILQHPITKGDYAAGQPSGKSPIMARFQVFNAWPMGYSIADLEAGGNAVVIERLDLAHEGWTLVTGSYGSSPNMPQFVSPSNNQATA